MGTAMPISNYDDTIDSRDVIERIEELRDWIQGVIDEGSQPDLIDVDELAELEALAEEASASPDWTYGETLIRDSYFEDYAHELADDLGAISGDESWPLNCIDWKWAARELKHDYSRVNYDGIDYWIRR